MQHITLILEDRMLIGHRTDPANMAGEWALTIIYITTGEKWEVSWPDHELAAVLTVAFQGDDAEEDVWSIAEAAFHGLPTEARLIP